MNRQQRRNMTKQKLSYDEITKLEKSIKTKTASDAIKDAVLNYSIIVALCLHDKLGFGHDRILRFINYVNSWFESVYDGDVNFDMIANTLKEETGITFERKK